MHRAMSADDMLEGEFPDDVDRLRPFPRVAIARVGEEAVDHVARGHNLLFRAKDHDVSLGVRPAAEGEVERVSFVMKYQGLSDGHRRKLEAEARHLSGVGFLLGQKFLMEQLL